MERTKKSLSIHYEVPVRNPLYVQERLLDFVEHKNSSGLTMRIAIDVKGNLILQHDSMEAIRTCLVFLEQAGHLIDTPRRRW
jgi:hypothetical protein